MAALHHDHFGGRFGIVYTRGHHDIEPIDRAFPDPVRLSFLDIVWIITDDSIAALTGRRRLIVKVPILSPGLSSHWIGLVTDQPYYFSWPPTGVDTTNRVKRVASIGLTTIRTP